MTVGQKDKLGSGNVAVTSVPAPPPLHVHVDSSTAVLVHIRKPRDKNEKGNETGKSGEGAVRGPWIPPPGKTSKGAIEDDVMSLKNATVLDATEYIPDPDFTQEINDVIADHMRKCAKRIETLDMISAGPTIPCPVHHHQSRHQSAGSDRQGHDEFLRRSLNVLRKEQQPFERQDEITAGLEYVASDPENELHPTHFQLDQTEQRMMPAQETPRDTMGNVEAQKQETLKRKTSKGGNRLPAGMEDASAGGTMQKLEAAERKNQELVCDLREQENQIEALKRQITCEKDYIKSLCRMQEELEETRACLQKELLSKNAELERSTIQMKNLQSQTGDNLAEVERLQAFVEQTTRRAECEKEGLKKALKLQYERTKNSEEALAKANKRTENLEREAESVRGTMHFMEQELERLRPEAEAKKELEKVCEKLQAHLRELQPVPEMLRETQQRLLEEQMRSANLEQRVGEQARLITELTGKIDQCFEDVRIAEERLQIACCENDALITKMEQIQGSHQQTQDTIAELNSSLQLKTELINQLNLKLEDKDSHSISITRQLEDALAESNRLSRTVEEKAFALEKQHHGRMKELEGQLACTKQEVRQLRQEKAELECKYGKQMADLKEKLEQCDQATHNMQSYISYLRTSYASVFNDPNLTTMCPPGGSPRKETC